MFKWDIVFVDIDLWFVELKFMYVGKYLCGKCFVDFEEFYIRCCYFCFF